MKRIISAAVTAALLAAFSAVGVSADNGGTAVSDAEQASFVERAYQLVLERDPDEAGKAAWLAYLQSGKSQAELLYDFYFNDAAAGNNINAADYLWSLYRGLLDRNPDLAGLSYWLDAPEVGSSGLAFRDDFWDFADNARYVVYQPSTDAYYKVIEDQLGLYLPTLNADSAMNREEAAAMIYNSITVAAEQTAERISTFYTEIAEAARETKSKTKFIFTPVVGYGYKFENNAYVKIIHESIFTDDDLNDMINEGCDLINTKLESTAEQIIKSNKNITYYDINQDLIGIESPFTEDGLELAETAKTAVYAGVDDHFNSWSFKSKLTTMFIASGGDRGE